MGEIGKYYDLSDDISLGGNSPSDHIAVSQYAIKEAIDTTIYNPFYVKPVGNSVTITITMKSNQALGSITLEYSNDLSTWTSVTITNSTPATITCNGTTWFRGNNSWWSYSDSFDDATVINGSTDYSVGGDITTLIQKSGNVKTLNHTGMFTDMFFNDSHLIDASLLVLPSTTLCSYCYCYMFEECNRIICGPQVLRDATLADNCCEGMFLGCVNLRTAPILKHSHWASHCYDNMFIGCSKLHYVRTYMTDPGNGNAWLHNVAPNGVFYCLSSAQWITSSPNGIPSGWTRYDI